MQAWPLGDSSEQNFYSKPRLFNLKFHSTYFWSKNLTKYHSDFKFFPQEASNCHLNFCIKVPKNKKWNLPILLVLLLHNTILYISYRQNINLFVFSIIKTSFEHPVHNGFKSRIYSNIFIWVFCFINSFLSVWINAFCCKVKHKFIHTVYLILSS